ncbi:uncharacterized protein TRIADDRAFT_58921 [Trichoplax adhaerens]|uniref:PXA domain-containing protein n=1 Tax=Trichoplax adhaerens TaxID=10228 RepID=B3S417_TRIAD|nr:hypothetical protein TRIADDRAFT_58921 [Trichoplax adhaerens]EDV22381.1 hypothetical protein TRIADDRAFT_58921 [Trichoplax adhaerens]|eukprot:XP_002114925.1 hypothetical protein TRIADDRAFT_58921 [Trichoplax adhaerens]
MKKKDSTHMFLSNEKIQSLSILTNIRLNRFLQRLWSYFSWRIYVLILAGLFYLYSHETTTWFLIYTVPPILGIWTATLALNNNISLRFEAFIQSLTESNPSRSSKNSHDRDHENEFKSVKLNPAAQAELNKLINYICRDFISTWYKNLSQSDHFEKETRKKLEQICSRLIDRIGNIDPHLFIQHLCGILTNHFHIYHECVKGFTHRASSNRSTPPPTAPPLSHQDSNDGSNRKDQEELIWQSYKARCSYQGITATQDGEQDYIRHMATLLLYALLSSDEFNSDTVRYLLREILASHILQSIIRSLSEPRIINRLLGKLIERVFTAYARRQAKSVKLAQLRQKKKNRPPNITVNQSNTLNQPINSNSVHDSSEYLSDVSNDSNTTKVINKQSAHGPGKDRSEKQGISNKGNNIRPRANTHTAAVQVPSQGNSSLSTKPIDEETNSIEVFANRNKAVHKNKNKLTLSKKLFKRVQPRFRLGSDETENSEKGTDDHNGNNTSNIQDENEEDEFAQSTATGLGNNAKRTHKSKRISKIYSSLIRDRSVQSNHRKTATFDGSSSYRSTHANENIPSKATRSHSYDDIDCVKKENENSFLKAFHKIKTISGKEDNHHNLTNSKDTILNLDFADKSTNGMKDLFNPLPQHQQIKDRTGIQIYVTSPAGHQRSNDDIFQEENQPDDVSLHFNPINKLEKLGFYKPISIPKTITAKDKTGNKYTLYCIEYYDSIWRNVEQHEESKSRNTFSLRAKKRQRIKSDESEKVADRHSLSLSKKNQCKDDIVDVIGSKNTASNGSFPFKVKKLFDVRLKRSRWQHTGSFVLDVADSENTDDIVYSLGHREIHHRFSEFFALNRRLRRRFSPADLKGLSLSGTRLVHAFSRFDPAVIENRRDMLECYLKARLIHLLLFRVE